MYKLILYGLVIYCFLIICKNIFGKIYKIQKYKKILSTKNCEYFLQYTYISSLIYAIYKYSFYIQDYPIYYLDIFGYLLVSISSYLYHNVLYTSNNALTNTLTDKTLNKIMYI